MNKQKHQKSKTPSRIILLALLTLAVSLIIWFFVSPVPSAFIIRIAFEKDTSSVRDAMEEFTDGIDVVVMRDLNYQDGVRDSKLDVYIPRKAYGEDIKLPVIIWTHGGAWISGSKTDVEPYFKILANNGFIVVAPNYTLAPGQIYPYQISQLNEAHRYIINNASDFHIDHSKIILAGSSAGAQISAQFAAMITSPIYAQEVGVSPNIKEEDLAATVLYCGVYDMQKLASGEGIDSGIIRWGFGVATWAYSGNRNPSNDILKQASPIHAITSDYPSSFISGGNGDGLTKLQSFPFYEKMRDLGIDVAPLFYDDDHQPVHGHDNQFVLDKDGFDNMHAMIDFLNSRTQ